ncbi:hypothetical protein N9N03_01690 [Chlamydiia bacterium]|nr:hypothetical protein [Chlamydiia bacterium]
MFPQVENRSVSPTVELSEVTVEQRCLNDKQIRCAHECVERFQQTVAEIEMSDEQLLVEATAYAMNEAEKMSSKHFTGNEKTEFVKEGITHLNLSSVNTDQEMITAALTQHLATKANQRKHKTTDAYNSTVAKDDVPNRENAEAYNKVINETATKVVSQVANLGEQLSNENHTRAAKNVMSLVDLSSKHAETLFGAGHGQEKKDFTLALAKASVAKVLDDNNEGQRVAKEIVIRIIDSYGPFVIDASVSIMKKGFAYITDIYQDSQKNAHACCFSLKALMCCKKPLIKA